MFQDGTFPNTIPTIYQGPIACDTPHWLRPRYHLKAVRQWNSKKIFINKAHLQRLFSMCIPILAREQSCWIPLMHQRVHYRRRYLVTLKSMQFHTLFTLLPEYFSTFLHSTCLLTVLWIIFSLRGSLSPIFRLYYQTILLADTIPYRIEWTANGPNTLYGFTSEHLCR